MSKLMLLSATILLLAFSCTTSISDNDITPEGEGPTIEMKEITLDATYGDQISVLGSADLPMTAKNTDGSFAQSLV